MGRDENDSLNFSRQELRRYSRNILLPGFGRSGQARLKNSIVSVVGAGGLGSPALFYLVAAGVGTIQIIDSDRPDLTNLQRQILYSTADLDPVAENLAAENGLYKAELAAERLKSLNPDISIQARVLRLTAENAKEVLSESDVVLEGSDNFPTKFLVNDACFFLKKPAIIAGISQMFGNVLGLRPGKSACYRCLFPAPPPAEAVPACAEGGVLGPMAGVLGSTMALEAVKYLAGLDFSLIHEGSMIQYEAVTTEMRKIHINKNQSCRLCGDKPVIHSLVMETQEPCVIPPFLRE